MISSATLIFSSVTMGLIVWFFGSAAIALVSTLPNLATIAPIERRGVLGERCLNDGRIPCKMLLHASEALQKLLSPDTDSEHLLAAALSKANKRVAVKRPKSAEPVAGPNRRVRYRAPIRAMTFTAAPCSVYNK